MLDNYEQAVDDVTGWQFDAGNVEQFVAETRARWKRDFTVPFPAWPHQLPSAEKHLILLG